MSVVFITHLPSTYKVNLYDKLSKKIPNMSIVFAGGSSTIRQDDFARLSPHLRCKFLSKGSFEQRSKIASIVRMSYLLIKLNPRILIINGWDLPEFLVSLLFGIIAKRKLILQVEGSDPYPAFTPRIATIFKRLTKSYKALFLNNSSVVLFSSPRGFNYFSGICKARSQRRVVINGVGITDIESQCSYDKRVSGNTQSSRFIGLSRYSQEKNIEIVASAFSRLPQFSYHHYGSGIEQSTLPYKLREIQNVVFNGHIENKYIPHLLASSCCLILLSQFEAWGLVAEEANLCGVPCIVSATSGYGSWSKQTGINLVIEPTDSNALIDAIHTIASGNHQLLTGKHLREIVLQKNRTQVNRYLEFLAP